MVHAEEAFGLAVDDGAIDVGQRNRDRFRTAPFASMGGRPTCATSGNV